MQRSLPPLSLGKPPLALVLAQVRMSPVEAMVEYIPAIQDRFRKAGFPEFRTRRLPGDLVWNGHDLVEHHFLQWEFADVANTTSILVSSDAITVQTTAYKRFEDLEHTIATAFTTVHDIVQLAQAHRFGLRYVNVVRFGDDPRFAKWITPSLLGLPHLEGASRTGSFSETMLMSDSGSRLVTRCMALPGGMPIPADLLPCTLTFPFLIPLDEPFVILDSDHSRTQTADFDAQAATRSVGELHELLDLAFRSAVTEHALKSWR